MPSRNVIREFAENEYYHVYNRGVEKRIIFVDEQDYTVFLGLLKKYLLGKQTSKTDRHRINRIDNEVQLLAYCLMPNHFHLLLHQTSIDGVNKLMRKLATGYVMYFNNRYMRVGGLFQGPYKASRINADAYLHHISRYIHLNPDDYKTWPYSSYQNYTGKRSQEWLQTQWVMELFDHSPAMYEEFVKDYVETRDELSVLKWQLANNPDD
ncbi:transposase [Candidatus Saccharibacteria bacterium]|nr:transposase [Candidatus Saccharibacteria bacterium]